MTYRKLPGHRRGIVKGGSLWMGDDHILSVKSMRFREEYKRFYLRDIQGIVIADAPRFHISTRSLVIGYIWLVAFAALYRRAPWVPMVFYVAAFLLISTWIWISAARSCRCRLYTAVSADDLPSIYRRWTARQFLDEVSPRIWQVQGVLQGDWANLLELRRLGPASPEVPVSTPEYIPAARRLKGPPRTWLSDLFVLTLFATALFRFLTLNSTGKPVDWIGFALLLLEIIGAVGVFIQHRRGQIDVAMRKLAIGALIAIGAMFYIRQVSAGVAASTGNSAIEANITSPRNLRILQEVDAGISLALGLVGAILSFRPRREPA